LTEQPQILSSDVAIVGAGPAGSSASICLAKAGVPHIIFDKDNFPRDKVCGDGLSGKVLHQLLQMDRRLVQKMAQRKDIFLDSWGVRFVAPNGKDVLLPYKDAPAANGIPPGFVAARKDFDAFLFGHLDPAFADIRIGCTVTDVRRQDDGILLHIANGRHNYLCKTKLLIAADGAHSLTVKKLLGLRVPPEHNLVGIRAYYKNVTGLHPENYIELHFVKELLPGYLWIFPLPGQRANVGVTMLSSAVRQRKLNLRQIMLHLLNEQAELKTRFRRAQKTGRISGWGLPAGSFKQPLSGEGFLLTGDAAALIDPFTGEGIGNAVLSGRLAAQTAAAARRDNNYSAGFLKEYDAHVNGQLTKEFNVNLNIRRLAAHPWLFNFLFNRLNSNKALQETFSAMFNNLDIRQKLRSPLFYLKLLFG